MNQGAKVLLGICALGGIAALVFARGEKKANASPAQPLPLPLPDIKPPVVVTPGAPQPGPGQGTIVVPPIPNVPVPPGAQDPDPNEPPPLVVPTTPPVKLPLPGGGSVTVPPIPLPSGTVPPGTGTFTINNPLTGQPLGTYNPETGNVFDATSGIVIGKFDPTTGTFTPTGGAPIKIPGFGSSSQPPTQTMPPMVITEPAPPPVTLPTAPAGDPAEGEAIASPDTIAVVKEMLAQEHSPRWRIMPNATLKAWQQTRGLGADGKFGTGSALRMAQEIGVLPIIRAWPTGTALESPNLRNFQNALRELAAKAEEPRRSQLLKAAQREQGQGYGTPERPITLLISEDA